MGKTTGFVGIFLEEHATLTGSEESARAWVVVTGDPSGVRQRIDAIKICKAIFSRLYCSTGGSSERGTSSSYKKLI